MGKKLALFLKSRIPWLLLFKIIFIGAAFSYLGFKKLNWWSGIFFVLVFAVVYLLEPTFRRRIFKTSFWLLAGLAFLTFGFLSLNSTVFWILLFLFTAVFWLLDGLINFSFKNHLLFYSLFSNLLTLAGAFLFMRLFFKMPLLVSLGWFVFLILNLMEFYRFWDIFQPKNTLVINAATALAGLEIGVFTSFLPLPLVNAAALLTLFVIFSRETALNYFKGDFDLKYLFRQAAVFILAAISIFLVTP